MQSASSSADAAARKRFTTASARPSWTWTSPTLSAEQESLAKMTPSTSVDSPASSVNTGISGRSSEVRRAKSWLLSELSRMQLAEQARRQGQVGLRTCVSQSENTSRFARVMQPNMVHD
eukprot:jgi/Botrbrau1/16072/Bobra.7_2s0043.1